MVLPVIRTSQIFNSLNSHDWSKNYKNLKRILGNRWILTSGRVQSGGFATNGATLSDYIQICIAHYKSSLHIVSIKCVSEHCISIHCVSEHCVFIHCVSEHSVSVHYVSEHCVSEHCVSVNCVSVNCFSIHCVSEHCVSVQCVQSNTPRRMQESPLNCTTLHLQLFTLTCLLFQQTRAKPGAAPQTPRSVIKRPGVGRAVLQ